MDDARFAHAVEMAAQELHDQCAEDVGGRTWANAAPAAKAAYRRIARRQLLAVLAGARQVVSR